MATYHITIDERTKEGRDLLKTIRISKAAKFDQHVKLSDPTEMTKAQFYAMIEKSAEQARQGKVTRVDPKDFKKFLGLE